MSVHSVRSYLNTRERLAGGLSRTTATSCCLLVDRMAKAAPPPP
jgi:hypothetical protein